MKNPFKREKREQTTVQYIPIGWDMPLLNDAFPSRGALFLSAVYSALSIISNSIAALPINVKQVKDNVRTVIEEHPICNLFYTMLQPKHTVIKQLVWDLLLYGNSYCYIRRHNGRPTELVYLRTEDVTIDYDPSRSYLYYDIANHEDIPIHVPYTDVLHFAKDTYDGVHGRGFLFFGRNAIKLVDWTDQAVESFFSSGCNVTGILQFSGRVTDDQKQKIRAQWQQLHGQQGSGLAVLEGDSKYTPVSSTSQEAQMLETREFNITEIARFFNISPILLGDLTNNSYSSIEDSQLEFISHTLLPLINLIEEECDRKLLGSSRTLYIDFDENVLISGNKATMSNYVTSLVSNGILTVNEGRKMLGYNAIEGGDDLIIPFTKIEDNTIGSMNEDTSEKNIDQEDDEQ